MQVTRLILACCFVGVLAACAEPQRPDAPAPDAGDETEKKDSDFDGVPDDEDNCPDIANRDQLDKDGDGIGDLCDEPVTPPPPACGFDFKHPLGYPCNVDSDCAIGFCADDGNQTFCTTSCVLGSETDCAGSVEMSCQTVGTGATPNICVPVSDAGPGDGSLVAGAPCNVNADCGEGGVCGAINEGSSYYTFCAPACESASDCGECGSCQAFGSGDSFCVPQGEGGIGSQCESRHDCNSFICVGYCTDVCDSQTPCADGASCVEVDEDLSICLQSAQIGATPVGGDCIFDAECADSNRCAENEAGTNTVCTAPLTEGSSCTADLQCAVGLVCAPETPAGDTTCRPPGSIGALCEELEHCESGLNCLYFGPTSSYCTTLCATSAECGSEASCVAADIDTQLAVYTSATASSASHSNDDIDLSGGNYWSQVRFTAQPGSYWVKVSAWSYGGSYGGYRLLASDGSGTPTVVEEIDARLNTTSNDTAAEAQVVSAFPVAIEGVLFTSNDVDYFQITIPGTSPVELVLETSPGAPSLCLGNSVANTLELGESCSFHQECVTGLCLSDSKVCGQYCDSDDECAEGSSCQPIGLRGLCISDELVGVLAPGESCSYDYECDESLCSTVRGESICTSECGEEGSCAEGFECLTSSNRCIPAGNGATGFLGSCLLSSDCQTGLSCEDGRCQQSCVDDSECPGAPPPLDEFTCKSCSTYSDCGDDSLGECWEGSDGSSFCVRPCDLDGACGAGYTCVEDWWDSYCVPDAGTCAAAGCAIAPEEQAGFCALPSLDIGEACVADFECLEGSCHEGICTQTCLTDADCDCPSGELACSNAGFCEANGTALEELEPNDEAATAQALGSSLPVYVSASISTFEESDFYSVQLAAGATVDIQVDDLVCGGESYDLDTRLIVYKDGILVAEDDEEYDWLGDVLGFVAPEDGEYLIEVRGEVAYGEGLGAYRLSVTETLLP